ncbi:unnamed protein product [Cladocopium goreaui]|uniref:Autophagy-related protein 18a n=1 Tax=Cladocopium goreaui TaxID=2562237 RepID=A0A9P1CAW7_9DINO|nr:unnamed protein product [Cladocopium goreaui]
MATIMAALAMIMMMLQMHLVSSQDTPDTSMDGSGSCSDAEEISALQLSSQQAMCEWRLGTLGQSCTSTCLPDSKICDPAQQKALRGVDGVDLNTRVTALQGGTECTNYDPPTKVINETTNHWAPYVSNINGQCRMAASGANSACGQNGNNVKRVCCCVDPPAQVDNDPHVHTLKGAHYTLLRSGNFLAWSFSKDPVDWHLLAAYSGARSRFTTQSLLLLEKQSGQTLEMTAEDCLWQTKTENGWRKVQPELLLQGAASVDVQEVDKHTRDPLNLESVMVLQMSEPEKSGVRKVARLLIHCSPSKYLNFKVKMFDTKDLDYVGGELGSAPRNQSHLSLLSAKLSSMVMQTDTEFQAKLMKKTFDSKSRLQPLQPV